MNVPRLLDGGLATQLEARGLVLDDPLWSGVALLEHSQLVADVHASFARAGADVLATATYQLSECALRERGLDEDQIADLYLRAVDVAEAGRRRAGRAGVWIAASVGSFGASLGGGEEYRGGYLRGATLDRRRLREFHRPRLRRLLADPRVDVVMLETFPAADEIAVVAELVDELEGPGPRRPVWASLTCSDAEHTSVGEPLVDAAARLRDAVDALGVNCSDPRVGASHARALREGVAGGRAGVLLYPNAGESYGGSAGSWVGSRLEPATFAELARGWLAGGLVAVGGCCRTTPGHIEALRDLIDTAGSSPRDA